MQVIAPLSIQRHGSKYWQRPNSFQFAAQSQFVPVAGIELSTAVLSLPLCFIRHKDAFQLVALLSPNPNENYYVGPSGRWAGSYIPSQFKWYPFSLEKVEGSDREKMALCVDESSDLLSDTEGELFFDENGQLSPLLSEVMARLSEFEKSRAVTDLAVAALADAGVIVAWDLKLTINKQEFSVPDVYRIDEATLNRLDDNAYLTLRKAQGIPIAYAQLFSMANTRYFQKLAEMRTQEKPQPKVDLDKLLGEDDIFKF